ncbi:MAG: type 1 glutamine amidotransferase [Candidatus Nanopelagicales bacterium]
MKRVEIVVIHPELLGTYGDGGNAEVLAHRARLAGVEAVVRPVLHTEVLPDDADVYCIGGGEDVAQIASVTALRGQGAAALATAMEQGAQLLAICAGLQLLGDKFPGSHGEPVAGLSLLPLSTHRGERRLIGEIAMSSTLIGTTLTGFENHRGITELRDGVQPLGVMTLGNGNGIGAVDGVVTDSVIGTYMHGPALARNPELADFILRRLGIDVDSIRDPAALAFATERRAAAAVLAARQRRRRLIGRDSRQW